MRPVIVGRRAIKSKFGISADSPLMCKTNLAINLIVNKSYEAVNQKIAPKKSTQVGKLPG